MAFGRNKATASLPNDESTPIPRGGVKSLVASALRVNFDDAGYNNWRFRDETWQRELWRLFDIIPEFGFAARWVGNCCSQVRIYVADVDKLGRVQGECTEPKIAALGDTIFGGPASKAEALRSCGINLTVAGECYILGKTTEQRDKWYVLSSSEIRRVKGRGGVWDWYWGPKGEQMRLDLQSQMVTRVWTPHPQRIWCADSPSRSCQPALRKMEQLTKYVFSQLDSRLVSAGLLVIPNNLDFPDDGNGNSAGESLMIRLATAGAASLRGEGTALGVLPHIVEAPPESIESGFKLVTFESALSETAIQLYDQAVNQLAVGMDMPPAALKGSEAQNHWNGYLTEGQGIKIHIEPLMNRICDALTEAYLIPALKILGKEPSRYVFAYDTSPLTLRPQRFQDALNLYEKNVLSAAAVREEGFFKESQAPTEKEDASRFAREVILRDPQLIQNQAMRELAGIPEELVPQTVFIMATPGGGMGQSGMPGLPPGALGPSGPPPPPAPPTGIQSELPPPIPDTLGNVGAPPAPPTGIQASAATLTSDEMALIVAAETTVRRAMEVAGKRLLDRRTRHQWPDVPHFDLHTRIKVIDNAHANRILDGAWAQLPELLNIFGAHIDHERLGLALSRYCANLLTNSVSHKPQTLLALLQEEGFVSGK